MAVCDEVGRVCNIRTLTMAPLLLWRTETQRTLPNDPIRPDAMLFGRGRNAGNSWPCGTVAKDEIPVLLFGEAGNGKEDIVPGSTPTQAKRGARS